MASGFTWLSMRGCQPEEWEEFCQQQGSGWSAVDVYALKRPNGLGNGFPNVKKMLITLCYVYLWVRFQKCYTVVIRNTLRRLCGSKSTSISNSFTFCALNPPGKSSDLKGQPILQHSFNKQLNQPLPEDTVFLKLGDKAIYITEPQVTSF